jgi:double-stranded uracil-DNA glycosylase
MTRVSSFPPIETPAARLLILGSMPGAASLAAGQYYAHPRNRFWPIMGELVGADPALPYSARIDRLSAAGIALWDVLASCVRPGSLDSAIDDASAEPNDFAGFFAGHPRISHVFFNGTKAEQVFRRRVLGQIPLPPLQLQRLPSTSPAHAGRTPAQKLDALLAAARFRA